MLRRRPSPWSVIAVTLLAAAGCDRSKAPASVERQAEPAPAQGLEYAKEARSTAGGAPAAGPPATTTPAVPLARKLIRTAQVTIEVKAFDEASPAVARIAEQHGGYVADTQITKVNGGRRRGTITLRVSADRFEAAMAALRALGEVESENVSSQDITKAYYDLENRLRVKQQTAERLREILKTKTTDLSDVLQAEQALARVTEEIEQLEGERRFYDQQVSLSTITATVHEPEALVRPGMADPVVDALRESGHVLAASVAAIIYAAVFLAPWLLVLWVLWRVVRGLRARRRAARLAAAAPATSGDTPGGRA